MKSLHRFVLGMCCVALSLLGFSTVASAHDFGVVHQFRHAVASVGEYGAQGAQLKAELAYMQSVGSSESKCGALMTSESNGFRLAALTRSGVGEGVTGVSDAYPLT
ncbi:hypothetical protein CNR33_00010 [Pseudomonas phage tabernarius]|uniref:Uncharacterized protein n=1 Tax=Pseudomonas phage tabernarius TaxID=2048978 RepID=A0A2H4P6N5_9CAUD|nr:hypothetical protein FDJ17_gp10 [Pseudomonas phage tabernarius]ATW57856.1 hypothetical protein CNR33_00010 [Pseudomonas phage tabernarius]